MFYRVAAYFYNGRNNTTFAENKSKMENEILALIVTAVTSGSLSWLVTIKFTRKQAEADAMKSVQDVYQELIEDLRTSNSSLKEKIAEMEESIKLLQGDVQRNNRRLIELQPRLCFRDGCARRILDPNDKTRNHAKH